MAQRAPTAPATAGPAPWHAQPQGPAKVYFFSIAHRPRPENQPSLTFFSSRLPKPKRLILPKPRTQNALFYMFWGDEVEKRKGEHILRSSIRLTVRANEHWVYPSLLHRELNSLYTFAPCKYGDCLRLASTFLKYATFIFRKHDLRNR